MSTGDLAGILFWAAFAGVTGFLVLRGNLDPRRYVVVVRWCFTVGTLAVAYFAVAWLIGASLTTGDSSLFFWLLGLPALVVGALLSGAMAIERYRTKTQAESKGE